MLLNIFGNSSAWAENDEFLLMRTTIGIDAK